MAENADPAICLAAPPDSCEMQPIGSVIRQSSAQSPVLNGDRPQPGLVSARTEPDNHGHLMADGVVPDVDGERGFDITSSSSADPGVASPPRRSSTTKDQPSPQHC
jgi:hypothetical protein